MYRGLRNLDTRLPKLPSFEAFEPIVISLDRIQAFSWMIYIYICMSRWERRMLVAIVKLEKILQQKGGLGSALFFFIVFELLRVVLLENESKCFVQKNARIPFLQFNKIDKATMDQSCISLFVDLTRC